MTEQEISDFVAASRREQGLGDHLNGDKPFETVAAILANAAQRGGA